MEDRPRTWRRICKPSPDRCGAGPHSAVSNHYADTKFAGRRYRAQRRTRLSVPILRRELNRSASSRVAQRSAASTTPRRADRDLRGPAGRRDESARLLRAKTKSLVARRRQRVLASISRSAFDLDTVSPRSGRAVILAREAATLHRREATGWSSPHAPPTLSGSFRSTRRTSGRRWLDAVATRAGAGTPRGRHRRHAT
jgi:hypothetical protein